MAGRHPCDERRSREIDGEVRDAGTGEATADIDETRFGRRPPMAQAGDVEGFNLHANVVPGALDAEAASTSGRVAVDVGGESERHTLSSAASRAGHLVRGASIASTSAIDTSRRLISPQTVATSRIAGAGPRASSW